jgi:receptor expression-enhancing protein 1/2/3/4
VLNKDPEQQKQWLCYWICFTVFTVFELLGDVLVSWLPLYWEAKMAFVVWLTAPQFKGATMLYNNLVHRYIERYEPEIDRHIESLQASAGDALAGLRRSTLASVREKGFRLASMVTQIVADAAAETSKTAATSASQKHSGKERVE